MADTNNLVRYRNDGDDFHVLWTARRALRLLDPTTDLVGVSVEGVSEREIHGKELAEGLLVVDTAEYYGSQDIRQARQIVYCQLKYSTRNPDAPWPVSGLAGTLEGFAASFREKVSELGAPEVLGKIRFQFVTNRPISPSVLAAFEAFRLGTSPKVIDKAVLDARNTLLSKTSLSEAEFRDFASLVQFLAEQPDRRSLTNLLAQDARRISLDSDATLRMKALVQDHTTSDKARDKVIDREKVLLAFRVTSDDLFPAPAKLEPAESAFQRTQEKDIASTILRAGWPVVIQAPGGIGKTILAQRLGGHMPPGSETILFDGFAAGDYRNYRTYRHRAARGVPQIVNQLAAKGLCDLLLPQNGLSEQTYLQELWRRLGQAAETVQAQSPDAVVLLIIDAADNLGMAAEGASDSSFAEALLQEAPPQGCRIVALARPHRVEQYLRPRQEAISIYLQPFSVAESGQLLRTKFPEASDEQVALFHHFTDCNPRVQANALRVASDLAALCESLGPMVETAETLVKGQLDSAFHKVLREQAVGDEFDRLGAALAMLPPPVPLTTLAQASGLTEDAIRSFVADFANGRPILIRNDAVQFQDEPTETWFKDKFANATAHWETMADRLEPSADTDAYVAAILPIVLHQAGRHDRLMELALGDASPEAADPVERRAIVLQRVTYGLRVAASRGRTTDTAKLLVRAAEEVAADDRQVAFLNRHADLIGHLAAPEVVAEHVFRHRPWRESGKAFIACAAMLSAKPLGLPEARQYFRLAMQWLRDWAAERRARPDDHSREGLKPAEVALYAAVISRLNGPLDMARFLGYWSGDMPFLAGGVVATQMLDNGDQNILEDLLADEGAPLLVRLAVNRELVERCITPPADSTQRLLDELLVEPTPIELPDQLDGSPIFPAIASVAEAAMRAKCPSVSIQDLLARYPVPHERAYTHYDPGGKRNALLRMASMAAIMEGRELTIKDVVPSRLRETWEKNRGHGRDEREFSDYYSALIQWHMLRERAIAREILATDVPPAAFQEQYEGAGPARYSNNRGVALLRMEALLWADGDDGCAADLENWAKTEQLAFPSVIWTRLAELAASRPTLAEFALLCAGRAREATVSERQNAGQTADDLMDIARALLPLGPTEAGHYLQEALDHVGRLSDEIHPHLDTLLTLAECAGTGRSSAPEAYRLARAAELLHAYNDHKFPWERVTTSVARLDLPSAFTAIARWDDRGVEAVHWTISSLAPMAMQLGRLSPETLVALHAFGGYWDGKDRAKQLFAGLPNKARRQTALDILVSDQELDRMAAGMSSKELQAEARRYGLVNARLESLTTLGQDSDREDKKAASFSVVEKELPDLDKLLEGLDPGTAAGINQAISRWRDGRGGIDIGDVFAAMRERVLRNKRADHIGALANGDLEFGSWAIEALEGCRKDWGYVPSVQAALRAAVRTVIDKKAEDLLPFMGWDRDDIGRCVAVGGESRPQLIRLMTNSISQRVRDIPTRELFRFVNLLAKESLSKDESQEVLTYALDRLEGPLRDQDGDGPWCDDLAPPASDEEAVAGFLYAMLASPEAETRWRAAHAVVRLGRLGQSSLLDAVVKLLPRTELPAFIGAGLPFYALHARLWLLIALARLAEDAPQAVMPYRETLIYWALNADEPHVLIRHFAAQAVLAFAVPGEAELDDDVIKRLRSVNSSAMEPVASDQTHYTGYDLRRGQGRSLMPYEFDGNWIAPLGNAFGIHPDDVSERVEKWICERWGISLPDHYFEPRSGKERRHGIGREQLSTFDSYRFYVCWHALLCAAGELVQQLPPALRYEENGWKDWIRRVDLTRGDGRWLSDRRDPVPLNLCPEMGEVGYNPEKREIWAYSIGAADLDAVLGLNETPTNELVVDAWWFQSRYENKQRVRVNSAMASPATSMALLRTLQTAENLDEDRDEVPDIFKLRNLVTSTERDRELDGLDVFAGEVSWPPPKPKREIQQLFELLPDKDFRNWYRGTIPVMRSEIWGARVDERRGDSSNSGRRVSVTTPFLKEILSHFGCDLIIEVELEREYEDQPGRYDHEHIANRSYNRIYLLRGATGRLHTLHGSVRLWPEAD
ncbi:P-loop NTPase family protein [Magnetospirillum molischianum]|uniref:NACHT domain-containing protein n=1 Tax=Magnetospirillum molischianum DSM 120 TaxID=1150626 RepID=H8FS02_MAGML|nr:hypothetical protein [Magnetospirillum molischianum]CCG41140.1 hypothetical protein PHAMO_260007 [Magnetospirillum molischianum DSM 120]